MIEAIETSYAGYRFRSRLEARWAVFFTKLGIKWDYEPQGYEFDGETYLPDFYLAQENVFVEVKGSDEQLHPKVPMLTRFVTEVKRPVVILGELPEPRASDCIPIHPNITEVNGEVLSLAVLVAQHTSGRGLLPTLVAVRLTTRAQYLHGIRSDDVSAAAYGAARSARFEHGESGAA